MKRRELSDLGLNQREQEIYFVLMRRGPLCPEELSRHTTVSRTSIYDVCERLMKKGLVSQSKKTKKTVFYAENPSFLIERYKWLSGLSEELTQEFFAYAGRSQVKPRIVYFEGKRGLQSVFEHSLAYKNLPMLQIVSIRHMLDAVGVDFMRSYIKRRASRGLVTRAINLKKGEVDDRACRYSSHSDRKYLRETRLSPVDLGETAMVMVYENNVAVVSSENESFGFAVSSKEFAGFVRAVFEVMWSLSKPI